MSVMPSRWGVNAPFTVALFSLTVFELAVYVTVPEILGPEMVWLYVVHCRPPSSKAKVVMITIPAIVEEPSGQTACFVSLNTAPHG